jgi:hypothetical protein
MRISIVKKVKVNSTFISLCLLFEEFHVRFGTESSWLQKYNFLAEYLDDSYAWLTDILALKSVDSGNYGVGSILIGADGKLALWPITWCIHPI